MTAALDAVEAALSEIHRARKRVAQLRAKQIKQGDLLDYVKAVAHAWFRSHRPELGGGISAAAIAQVDGPLNGVLDATTRASARATYVRLLDDAKAAITALRSVALTLPPAPAATSDPPPDFSPLASDPIMQAILARRWDECQRCLRAGAHLAATVMMGGFLEALFVARANQLKDKGPMFRAKATPIDGKTGKPRALSEWTLSPYIDVAEELGWITKSGQGVAIVLRDYRNYVHPAKERSHGVTIGDHDSLMFWDVTKNLTRQLLALRSK